MNAGLRRVLGVATVVAVVLGLAACGYGVTGAPADIGTMSATLTGLADRTDPGAIAYWFEYGTTTGYGTATETQTASITGPIPVTAVVDGLTPDTTYHYRLCVNSDQNVGRCGADLVLTTLAQALVVNHAADAHDAQPGDGRCQDQSAAAGACSLRAAIEEADAHAGGDIVTVQPGVGAIVLTLGELLVDETLTVQGNGATIDGGHGSRVLHVAAGQLTLERATVSGGVATSGAGLLVDTGATATVVDTTVTHNESTGVYACTRYSTDVSPPVIVECHGAAAGAGIASAGVLHLTRSTVSDNHAVGSGCGATQPYLGGYLQTCAWAQGAGVNTTGGTVLDSTISGNWSDGSSAANGLSASVGTTAVSQSTVVDNLGGAPSQLGVCCSAEGHGLPADGVITAQGSIIGGASPVCYPGGVASSGHNLVTDSGCSFTQPGDQEGVAPMLGPLTDNGGPTPTRIPYAGSPAVDAVPAGTTGLCDGATPADQRGVARPQGPACDVGAVEGDSGAAPDPLTLVVNHGGDDTDSIPGDGICQDLAGPAGACSLRAAIRETNAWPGPDTIVVDPGLVIALTRSTFGDTDIGDLDVTDDLTVDGGGATVDAAGRERVFDVSAADLALRDATLTGGSGGGGLRFVATGHQLHLTDVTVRGNTAVQGGGLYLGGGIATVQRSTISSNTSSAEGGGAFVVTAGLTLTDSTVSGNATTATGIPSKGGAIYAIYSSSVHVVRSTIADNTTPVWGALYRQDSETEITVAGSVLANPGQNCNGAVSLGHNVVTDTSCVFAQPGDRQGVDPQLGPLADNGGPTWTQLPAASSPLLDAIPPGTAGVCDGTGETDQRGVTRPQGPGCDIGAIEVTVGA